MAHIITDACTNDGHCVEVCPTDCIKEDKDQHYIDPEECIDCGSCVEVCPSDAIFEEDDLPDDKKDFIDKNANFFA
ncbi:indolepyruvate ferredoxin oxidoreductase subunit alpha [candidate division KSB1 bacterium]